MSALRIKIVKAEGLRRADWIPGRSSDPYVVCEIRGKPETQFKTFTVQKNLNPVFNFEHTVHNFHDGDVLTFQVYDEDFLKNDDFLGQCEIHSNQIPPQGRSFVMKLAEAGDGISASLVVEVVPDGFSADRPEALHPDPGTTFPIELTVVSAQGLRDADKQDAGGSSDPYVWVEVLGHPPKRLDKVRIRTQTIWNELNPVWNFVQTIPEYYEGAKLKFSVYDQDEMKRDDPLGWAELETARFYPYGFYGELKLNDAGRGVDATLTVKVVVPGGQGLGRSRLIRRPSLPLFPGHAGAGPCGGPMGPMAMMRGGPGRIGPGGIMPGMMVGPCGGMPAPGGMPGPGMLPPQPGVGPMGGMGIGTMMTPPGPFGTPLYVKIMSAQGMRKADMWPGRTSDPYCMMEIVGKAGTEVKSPAVDNTTNPVWNFEHTYFHEFSPGDVLQFSIYDKDLIKWDDFLGRAVISSSHFWRPQGWAGELHLHGARKGDATLSVQIKPAEHPDLGYRSAEVGPADTPRDRQRDGGGDAARDGQDRAQPAPQPMFAVNAGPPPPWLGPPRPGVALVEAPPFPSNPSPLHMPPVVSTRTVVAPPVYVNPPIAAQPPVGGLPIPPGMPLAPGMPLGPGVPLGAPLVRVRVQVIGAQFLRSPRWLTHRPPSTYCTCEVIGRPPQVRTPTVRGEASPAWNSDHVFEGVGLEDVLDFQVWVDEASRPHELLGRATMNSLQFFPHGFHGSLLLFDEGRKPGRSVLTVKVDPVGGLQGMGPMPLPPTPGRAPLGGLPQMQGNPFAMGAPAAAGGASTPPCGGSLPGGASGGPAARQASAGEASGISTPPMAPAGAVGVATPPFASAPFAGPPFCMPPGGIPPGMPMGLLSPAFSRLMSQEEQDDAAAAATGVVRPIGGAATSTAGNLRYNHNLPGGLGGPLGSMAMAGLFGGMVPLPNADGTLPLKIMIIGAQSLRKADLSIQGKDAYATCEVHGRPETRFRTGSVHRKDNPVWAHEQEMGSYVMGEALLFSVFDRETRKADEFLGRAILPFKEFYPFGYEGMTVLADRDDSERALLTVRVTPIGARPGEGFIPPGLMQMMGPHAGMGMGMGSMMMNGMMANGMMATGPMANGMMASGPLANGMMVNGPMANGMMANGMMANGMLANGMMANGPMANGMMANGPMANGMMANSPMANGMMANGLMANGMMASGMMPPHGGMPCGAMRAMAGCPYGPMGPLEGMPVGYTNHPGMSNQLSALDLAMPRAELQRRIYPARWGFGGFDGPVRRPFRPRSPWMMRREFGDVRGISDRGMSDRGMSDRSYVPAGPMGAGGTTPIKVTVMRAENLQRAACPFLPGKAADAYVLLEVRGKPESYQTQTIEQDFDPEWNHEFLLQCDEKDSLTFTAYDEEDDKQIGHAKLRCSQFLARGGFEGPLVLEGTGSLLNPNEKASLFVRIQVVGPPAGIALGARPTSPMGDSFYSDGPSRNVAALDLALPAHAGAPLPGAGQPTPGAGQPMAGAPAPRTPSTQDFMTPLQAGRRQISSSTTDTASPHPPEVLGRQQQQQQSVSLAPSQLTPITRTEMAPTPPAMEPSPGSPLMSPQGPARAVTPEALSQHCAAGTPLPRPMTPPRLPPDAGSFGTPLRRPMTPPQLPPEAMGFHGPPPLPPPPRGHFGPLSSGSLGRYGPPPHMEEMEAMAMFGPPPPPLHPDDRRRDLMAARYGFPPPNGCGGPRALDGFRDFDPEPRRREAFRGPGRRMDEDLEDSRRARDRRSR